MEHPTRSLLRGCHGCVPTNPDVEAPVMSVIASHGGVNKKDAEAGVTVRIPSHGAITQGDIVTLY